MKTNINITLDTELVAEGRARGVKWSQVFNDYLKDYLAIKREEKTDHGAEIERLKILLQQAEVELENQKDKNVKDKMKAIREGRILRG